MFPDMEYLLMALMVDNGRDWFHLVKFKISTLHTTSCVLSQDQFATYMRQYV